MQSWRAAAAGEKIPQRFWNKYPGCRVDTESTVYAYSFDKDLSTNWEWSERYALQPEVLAYLNAVSPRAQRRDPEMRVPGWDITAPGTFICTLGNLLPELILKRALDR